VGSQKWRKKNYPSGSAASGIGINRVSARSKKGEKGRTGRLSRRTSHWASGGKKKPPAIPKVSNGSNKEGEGKNWNVIDDGRITKPVR